MPSRWLDPFADLDVMGNFDRMVSRFFGDREEPTELFPSDIWEDEDKVHVELELPGVKPEDVSVSYEDGILRIEGEKKQPEHKGNVHLSERDYGRFHHTFQLPNVIDPSGIQANFRNGVLEVTGTKKPETKPHKIEVKTS